MSRPPSNEMPPPEWLEGRGLGPQVKWTFGTDGALTALAHCRESGDVIVADGAASLYRLDRSGQIASMTRLHEPARALAWSDDGQWGAAVVGEEEVIRFDSRLKTDFVLDLGEPCLSVAVAPFGHHLLAALADGRNLIYNERKRRISQFETIRPLSFSRFCVEEDVIIAAAEHGLICCHQFSGAQVWQEKLWSNVGSLQITGDGDLIYVASFNHGIQAFDGDGVAVGSYILDGTVNKLAVSYDPQRLIASTVERGLYWLDADGELLWATSTPDDVVELLCDPLGEWAVCGFTHDGVYRLDWGGV